MKCAQFFGDTSMLQIFKYFAYLFHICIQTMLSLSQKANNPSHPTLPLYPYMYLIIIHSVVFDPCTPQCHPLHLIMLIITVTAEF